ncbi:MAG TPA: DUF2125 domain-containing protein [Rhizomicrobium sp.]|jgi:hypothetical protein
MRYSSRFFLYGPFSLFVILAVAVGVQWWREAGAWTRQIDALNGHEISPGITLRFSSRQIAGFPFRVDTIFKDVRISFAGPRAFQWRTDEFALHRLSYGSPKTVFEAGGKQTFSWIGSDGKQARFTFLPGSVRAGALTANGRLARFDLVIVAFDSPEITAGRVEVHLRHDPKLDALDLFAFADSLSLPQRKTLARAQMDSRITMAQFLKGLLSGDADWRTALEAWRGGEGRVELIDVQSKEKLAPVDTKGRLMLNGQHQFTGTLADEMFGFSKLETAPLY